MFRIPRQKVSSGIGWVKFQGLRVFATVGEVYYAKWHYMKYCTQVIKYSLRRHTDPDSDAKEKNERTWRTATNSCPFFDVEMILKNVISCYFSLFWEPTLFLWWFLFRAQYFVEVLEMQLNGKICAGETCAYVMQLKMRRPWHRRSLGDKRMILINLSEPLLLHTNCF